MKNNSRTREHQRNHEVERTIAEISELLSGPNEMAMDSLPVSNKPNIYIVGCARSGSTILFQLLAKHLEIAYPTNFLSRFYFAPYIGARLQYLLSNLDIKKENLAAFSSFNLTSNLGKTEGSLSPHEFWYYWRSKFKLDDLGYISEIQTDSLNGFLKGINAIKVVFNQGFLMKGLIANSSISKFVNKRPQDIVIYIKRDIRYNAQSLLNARKAFFGNTKDWYSFGIPMKDNLNSPVQEVVQQVIQTNSIIESQLKLIDERQVFTLSYETLDFDLNELLYNIPVKITEPITNKVINQNAISVPMETWDEITNYYEGNGYDQ